MAADARPHLVVIGKVVVAPLAQVGQLRTTYQALAPYCARIDLIGEAQGDVPIEESDGPLHVHGLPVRGGLAGHLGFVRYTIRQVKALEAGGAPDVYWLSDPFDSAVAAWWSVGRRTPVVAQIQGDMLNLSRTRFGPAKRWLMGRLTVATARYATRVRTVSQHIAQTLGAAGIPAEKMVVIPPRTDLASFSPERHGEAGAQLRASWGWGPEQCVILYVGAFNGSKGVDLLMQAATAVQTTAPQLRWVLVGDGPMRAEMEQLAADAGLTETMRFEGFVDYERLPVYYAAADAGIVSSRDEGIGRGGIQAAAMGLPVIMTDVGGNREVVSDGQTGWLVAPSVAGLTEALRALAALGPDQRAAMGRAGRAHLDPIFDFGPNIRAMAEQMLPAGWRPGPTGPAAEEG